MASAQSPLPCSISGWAPGPIPIQTKLSGTSGLAGREPPAGVALARNRVPLGRGPNPVHRLAHDPGVHQRDHHQHQQLGDD